MPIPSQTVVVLFRCLCSAAAVGTDQFTGRFACCAIQGCPSRRSAFLAPADDEREAADVVGQVGPFATAGGDAVHVNDSWQLQRAEFRLRTGDLRGALADFTLFNAFGPKVDPQRGAVAHRIVRQAMCHDLLGEFDEGTVAYEKAASLPKDSSWPHEVSMRQLFWLAKELWKMGRQDEARGAWSAAIERTRISFDSVPSDLVRFNLGVAHYRLGNFEASWQHFQETIDFLDRNDLDEHSGHGNSGAFYFFAMNHASLGKKDEAQEWFDRGQQWDKQHASSLQSWNRDSNRALRQEAAELLGVSDAPENTETPITPTVG